MGNCNFIYRKDVSRTPRKTGSAKLTGDISFEEMMSASKDSIAFSKEVTILPDRYMPESGRKKDLESLINKYNITDVVINMRRDRAGANDLQRMKDLGFEVQARTLGEARDGSSIPPKDYYFMVRTGKAKQSQPAPAPQKRPAARKVTNDNEPIAAGTDREQRRLARANKRQVRAMKYGRPKGSR